MNNIIIAKPKNSVGVSRVVVERSIANYLTNGGKITKLKDAPEFKVHWANIMSIPDDMVSITTYENMDERPEREYYGV